MRIRLFPEIMIIVNEIYIRVEERRCNYSSKRNRSRKNEYVSHQSHRNDCCCCLMWCLVRFEVTVGMRKSCE